MEEEWSSVEEGWFVMCAIVFACLFICVCVCTFVCWFVGSITFPSCELFNQTGTYTMVASNTSGKVQRLVVLTVHKEGEGLWESVDGEGVANVKQVPIKEFRLCGSSP